MGSSSQALVSHSSRSSNNIKSLDLASAKSTAISQIRGHAAGQSRMQTPKKRRLDAIGILQTERYEPPSTKAQQIEESRTKESHPRARGIVTNKGNSSPPQTTATLVRSPQPLTAQTGHPSSMSTDVSLLPPSTPSSTITPLLCVLVRECPRSRAWSVGDDD